MLYKQRKTGKVNFPVNEHYFYHIDKTYLFTSYAFVLNPKFHFQQ